MATISGGLFDFSSLFAGFGGFGPTGVAADANPFAALFGGGTTLFGGGNTAFSTPGIFGGFGAFPGFGGLTVGGGTEFTNFFSASPFSLFPGFGTGTTTSATGGTLDFSSLFGTGGTNFNFFS